jgi:hypothetical protein
MLAGAGAVVALVGLGLGWWSGGASAAPARALDVRTSLEPRPVLFGDPLVAHVDVLVDRHAVAPDSVRVRAGFAPYAQAAPVRVRRSRAGGGELLRFRYELACLTDACLAIHGTRSVRFSPVEVAASRRGGGEVRATEAWPAALVASRLRPADLAAAEPRFRAQTELPAPVFGVAPGALAAALTAAAALLAAAAIALLGLEARRLRARPAPTSTPLEAALARTRESARRPDARDRRKALGLLAAVLERDGDAQLAGAAGALAWAEPAPTPERTDRLADEVESAVRGSR